MAFAKGVMEAVTARAIRVMSRPYSIRYCPSSSFHSLFVRFLIDRLNWNASHNVKVGVSKFEQTPDAEFVAL